jgi:hypothetical protein
MPSFEREDRYLVLKRSDIEKYLDDMDRLELNVFAEKIANGRMEDGRERLLKCAVVEHDWPEYEPTWKAIEERVTGKPPSSTIEDDAIERLTIATNELRNLAEGIEDHITLKGWFTSGKPAFGDHYVYADDFRGMGRQHICLVPADKRYFGKLHEFIAAANPKAIIALLDRLEKSKA